MWKSENEAIRNLCREFELDVGGGGLSCGFTVSPWSGGCLTIPVSSCCSIQDISSTEPISSEKLTDSSKKPEGTYLTSYNPMPLKIVWR